MSAPTQALPSWLTLSTTLVTLPDGSLSTSSATLRLPLTYYGPSIPLGTDGVWTYGGLTPPPSTTATPTSTTSTSPATSTVTPAPTVSSSSMSSATSPTSSSLPPSSSTAAAAANGSHGISPGTLGAILGSILGTLLLLVLIAILFLLRQSRRRQADPHNGHPSSSFWNRQTTLLSLLSRDARRQTPIWTGWEIEFSEVPPYASIRVVEPSTSNEQESPLIPPPPLNPDSLGGASRRFSSQPSLRSQKSKTEARSVMSEKSLGSVGTDPQEEGAELLTARRVKVGQLNPLADPAAASSSTATPSVLGLDRLANLGRLSWFKRMSFLGTPTDSRPLSYADPETAATADPYTRTPPRHSRNGSRSRPASHSRPGSFARASPTADSFGRRPGLGLGPSEDRPISTVSGRSAASGNTMYYDAQSRPASSMGTRSSAGTGTPATGSTAIPPVPPMPHMQPSPLSHEVQRSTPSPEGRYASIPTEPPAYDEHTTPRGHGEHDDYTEVDVLDIPAPRPASPFSAASSRPTFPPGLVPLPTPRAWRDSHASSSPSPATDSTSGIGIGIDILEDEPPSADNGWRSLAGSFRPNDGRRTTFGVPTVVQPRDALHSERGSLHSMRSHLSPHSSMSPAGSAPASSRHTLTGSGSSRPTASSHSRGLTASSGGSLAHSSSISSEDRRRRRGDVGEIASPPLSAVWPGRGFPSSPPPPAHTHGEDAAAYPPAYPAEGPLPAGMRSFPATVTGTMTSSGTRGTTGTDESLTDESVTTTQTDPITGAVMHFPRLPWRSRQDRAWGDAPLHEDAPW
ncbi:hypothetical protein FKP32DRAFT_1584954 [Trametes sanguinea]|nr:hypothetical protein FKP32DRAFT_1584954 [Trametes sanguinea]